MASDKNWWPEIKVLLKANLWETRWLLHLTVPFNTDELKDGRSEVVASECSRHTLKKSNRHRGLKSRYGQETKVLLL